MIKPNICRRGPTSLWSGYAPVRHTHVRFIFSKNIESDQDSHNNGDHRLVMCGQDSNTCVMPHDFETPMNVL